MGRFVQLACPPPPSLPLACGPACMVLAEPNEMEMVAFSALGGLLTGAGSGLNALAKNPSQQQQQLQQQQLLALQQQQQAQLVQLPPPTSATATKPSTGTVVAIIAAIAAALYYGSG